MYYFYTKDEMHDLFTVGSIFSYKIAAMNVISYEIIEPRVVTFRNGLYILKNGRLTFHVFSQVFVIAMIILKSIVKQRFN